MKKIGIYYLCTGPYVLFWEDFFTTFEKNFLPSTEKHYYVFTDSDSVYAQDQCDRIHTYKLSKLPWPLVTLFRFDTFLSVREEVADCDYLMFSNANVVCENMVTEEEFLPDISKGQELAFTAHPGYYRAKKYRVPYDRNKDCLAYIPYNQGGNYVIGAMFCGTKDAFLNMSEVLKCRIEEDLKKNVIARWHDESHINRFIVGKDDYKLLSPAYCYPVGFDLPVERKICGVSKQAKFDVNTFKGNYVKAEKPFIRRAKKLIKLCIDKEFFGYLRDTLLFRKVEKI